jgi:hypothetical protein
MTKTPQIAALPGMTPLGIPTKLWSVTVAYTHRGKGGLWFGVVHAETEEGAKARIINGFRGYRGRKLVSVQAKLSGWNR